LLVLIAADVAAAAEYNVYYPAHLLSLYPLLLRAQIVGYVPT
jgi:hypothetical protein